MSEPVPASAQQNTLGPAPTSPSLTQFSLTEADLTRLPRLWFDEFAVTGAKRFFNTYGLVCIAAYVIIFRSDIHFSVGYVVGFFAFAFVSIIPFGLFWLVMGFVERKLYSACNEQFANYCRYQDALSAYHQSKASYNARVAKQQTQYWRSLSGIAFEEELGKLYRRMGYDVQYTPSTADGGVDLCLRRDGKLTVVQCKAHNKRIPIGVARELVASMIDYRADSAIIACFEGLTNPAAEYIQSRGITVLTVDQIVALQKQHP
jgi:HJR/Mrr/RecB family endonuclease